jgi:hypothetical protein
MEGVVCCVQILLFVNIQAILFFRFVPFIFVVAVHVSHAYLVNVLST